MARLFNDSKTFVDMRLKQNPEQVIKAFAALGPNPNKTSIRKFVSEYFMPAGKDLVTWTPSDWKEKPSFIDKVISY
jgi:alpha,alpha-trehalase